MSVNINLADKRNPNQERKEKAKKIKAISIVLLIITAFLAIIIFIVDYRFSVSYVRKQEAELMKSLEPYTETSSKLFIINTKLTDIVSLISQRNNYDEKVKLIINGKSDDLEIEEFIINQNGAEIIFSSASLTPIDDYLNNLIKLTDEGILQGVTLNSLESRNDDYEVEVIIIL